MKKFVIVIFYFSLSLIISSFSVSAEINSSKNRITNDEKPIRRPILHIESFNIGDTKPMLGKTLHFTATIRNDSDQDIDGAKFQLYQGDQKIGLPLEIDNLTSDSEVSIELPFRISSIGRYTIKAAISPSLESATISPAKIVLNGEVKDLTFVIKTLPSWWLRLNKVLDETKTNTLTNYSRMEGLENNSLCETDVQYNMVLQKYGQSFLDAVSSKNDFQAEESFADALNHLSKFAEMLYCIDIPRLQYWDRSIAKFWNDIADKPENTFTINEAILATWNPALLVIDALQHTGHSELIKTYQDLFPHFEKALKSYPTDTFGAAWLDAFGMGILIRTSGISALKNLQQALAEPQILGFGTCPLATHAQKIEIDRPCFYGIELSSANCGAADLSDIWNKLAQANMLFPLIQGNLAAASGASIAIGDLKYFGDDVPNYINELCIKVKSMKPDLQGLAEEFADSFSYLSGCGFAMLNETLSGAGGEGGRIMQCFEQRSSQIPSSPIQPIKVSFPITECAYGQGEETDIDRFLALYNDTIDNFEEKENGDFVAQGTHKNEDGSSKGYEYTFDSSGNLKEVQYDSFDANSNHTSWEKTEYRSNGTTITTRKDFNTDGSNKETITANYPSGKTKTWITNRDNQDKPIGKTKVKTTWSKNNKGRPTEPGEDGCGRTAAMQRARALYNCIFYDPQINPVGGPMPVSRPLGPTGRLPAECDSIDPGKFWGSSTSSRGGAYDPPPWMVGGGPIIYQRFIPRIHGVIDPPKDWVTIPIEGNIHNLPE